MIKTSAAIVLALTVAATLSACGPTTPVPVVTTTPTPTATAEPAVEITAPTPSLDLECSDLVPATTIATLFTGGVAAVDPEQTIIEAGDVIPYKYDIEQLGGIACEWSNGEPQSAKVGDNAAYRGTSVSISPVSPAEWAEFVAYYGVVDNRQVYCFENCYGDLLVGGAWWVEVALQATDAANPLASFTAEVAAIEAAITSAAPSGETWAVPEGTVPLSADCEAILPAANVQSALALSTALQALPPFGGVSLDGTSRDQLDAIWCNYMPVGVEATAGVLQRLPGGEWAWNEAHTFNLLGGPADEIEVAGFENGDSAWVRCPASGACVVDVIVGHNWLQFATWFDGSATTVDRRAAIESIAASIVATVRA